MKTDEKKGDYISEAEEALQMLGEGYEPAIEIEAARTVTERRGGKLIETERTAFVKIYTTFKDELKNMDGDDLKVWLYLALSVNRYTGDARPGLRKIAEDTDMAVNTVRAAIERLENKNLLDVTKKDGIHNCYRPSDYVSVKKETVSNPDTPAGTVSKIDTTVSKKAGTVSTPRRDFAQLEELDKPEKPDALDGIIHYQLKPKGLRDAFAKYFKLTPNWEAKYNRQFLEWLVSVEATPEQIEHAADLWRKDKRFNWTVPTLKGIQEHWLQLIENFAGSMFQELQPKRAMPTFDENGRRVNA